MTVNFTDECVNVVNVYNIYKENFVKETFDLSTEKSVDAMQSIYNIARDSEVLRSFVVELVPKMATNWSNGEKFLNMELPITGDNKEIVLDLLSVYKSSDFNVLDRNIAVMFDVIKIANKFSGSLCNRVRISHGFKVEISLHIFICVYNFVACKVTICLH